VNHRVPVPTLVSIAGSAVSLSKPNVIIILADTISAREEYLTRTDN
jgi:hypothetical protein